MCVCVCVLKGNILREQDKDKNPTDRRAIKPTDRQKIEREEGERESGEREKERTKKNERHSVRERKGWEREERNIVRDGSEPGLERRLPDITTMVGRISPKS